ncbi:unannotated protein [freshwater metagenome]|uniref:Unannotated protein n=1 Tax=freshwater metagenome TaxID=449393 RepID=A0A6J5Z1I7_9ZZZZ
MSGPATLIEALYDVVAPTGVTSIVLAPTVVGVNVNVMLVSLVQVIFPATTAVPPTETVPFEVPKPLPVRVTDLVLSVVFTVFGSTKVTPFEDV